MARLQTLDYHTFLDYDPSYFSFPGIIVPQAVYRGPAPFESRPSITFVENGQPGVRLTSALNDRFEAMEDRDAAVVLSDSSSRITCRILWPGYDDWSQGVHIIDGLSRPIRRSRLALAVARAVNRFMNDVEHVRSTEPRPDWAVPNVRFEDLFLLELRQVSAGSWQPVLRLAIDVPPTYSVE